MSCDHPSGHVHYYMEITDDGDEYEDAWCDLCNFWLTPAEQQEVQHRPNFKWAD